MEYLCCKNKHKNGLLSSWDSNQVLEEAMSYSYYQLQVLYGVKEKDIFTFWRPYHSTKWLEHTLSLHMLILDLTWWAVTFNPFHAQKVSEIQVDTPLLQLFFPLFFFLIISMETQSNQTVKEFHQSQGTVVVHIT